MKEKNIEFYYTQPESIQSRLIKLLFKISGLKQIMKHFSGSKTLINLSSTPYPIRSLKIIAHIRREFINEKNIFTLSSKDCPSETVVLYLHGGAFTINFTRPHWNFIRALLQQTHCTVVAPNFPLLPDYDYKARLDIVYKVYERLLKTTDSKNITFMGDSSGGTWHLGWLSCFMKIN